MTSKIYKNLDKEVGEKKKKKERGMKACAYNPWTRTTLSKTMYCTYVIYMPPF